MTEVVSIANADRGVGSPVVVVAANVIGRATRPSSTP